jgi:hypothetical protein
VSFIYLNDSLLDRLNRFKIIDPDTGCWRFMGSRYKGYGQININKKIIRVHRLSAHIFLDYDLNNHDFQINHKCKYRDCWNPDHLYIGTSRQNLQDTRNKDFFNCGHPRSKENTIVKLGTNRYIINRCRECQNSRRRVK